MRGSASHIKEEYVEIVAFALMPNHYHIILKQIADNGISKYMHKLGTGYTMYFNKKNKRSGSLFEGRFKAKAITNDEYLVHLSRYIHLNPVSLKEPDWKDCGINDKNKIKKYLEKYRWSSYCNYINSNNIKGIDNIHTKYIL
ncbi:MAG: transposase, partial [Elusimicrobia bacterium]|nr:transposase [Elusimicrobiota bacterium]